MLIPCEDLANGAAYVANYTNLASFSNRGVSMLRADGRIDVTRFNTAFVRSTTTAFFRTVTSVDGSGFWMTGSSSNSAFHGMHYVPAGSATTTRVLIGNAANQRWVHVGPSWPGSGNPPSVPQLYISFRDALAQRGIHAVVGGLPTTNVTGAGMGTVLLPGFAALQIATNNAVTPLIGSFCFTPDATEIWAADTQGWQTLVPAVTGFGRTNLVSYVWNAATAAYERTVAMFVDSDATYTGTQIQAITGRYEGGVWRVYTCTNTKLFRVTPSEGLVTVIATAPSGSFFISPVLAPVHPLLVAASVSASITATASPSATLTSSPSNTASATTSPTSSLAPGASASQTSSATPSLTPIVPAFTRDDLLVLAGGAPGGPALTAVVHPMHLLTMSRSGDVLSSRALPTATDAAFGTVRCGHQFSGVGYQTEMFAQRSYDGTLVVFPCNDVPLGVAYPNNISARVVNTVDVAGNLRQFVVRTMFRDATAAGALFRTVATVDGSRFWATGVTTSPASQGLHTFEAGSSTSEIVHSFNVANHRYVTVGPAFPGAEAGDGAPQLYVSMRDPVGARGVHAVGVGLPSTNVSAESALLPGFGNYNAASNNATAPLVGSFTWESATSLWLCDTQGWQTLVPPVTGFARINVVNFVYDSAMGGFVRGQELPVDSSAVTNYTGAQVQLLHGRYEEGVWTMYTVTTTKLFKIVPSSAEAPVTQLATAPAGMYFISFALPPFRADLPALSPSSSRTATPSASPTASLTSSASTTATVTSSASATLSMGVSASSTWTPTGSATASVSSTATPTASRTATRTQTAAPTPSRSETPSVSSSPSASASVATPSATGSPSASPSSPAAVFLPDNLLVLRGGVAGAGNLTAGAQQLALAEFTPDGLQVSLRNLTTAAAAAGLRCTLALPTATYALEGFTQRSYNGALFTFGCNDVTPGAAVPNNITGRVIGVLNAEGALRFQRVTTALRDSTSSTLFRTVATLDGSGFWLGGSTSSAGSAGLHYVPAGSATTTRVVVNNGAVTAANLRYIAVGPSHPGSGNPPSVPQLYVSVRDPVGVRGVHAVGVGLPTGFNVSTTLLPGFAKYNVAANNLTTPLIGSFAFTPDARTLVTIDTQGWQGLVPPPPAFERINLVSYVWSDERAEYVLDVQMSVDPPSVTGYAGQQVQALALRTEPAVLVPDAAPEPTLVAYIVNSFRLLRCVLATRLCEHVAYAEPGTMFYSVHFPPQQAGIQQPSASATRTPGTVSPSRTSTPSVSVTRTATPSSSGTTTATVSSSGTATNTASASGTATSTASPSTTGTPASTASTSPSATASSSMAPTGSRTGTPSSSASRTGTPSPSATSTGSVSATSSETGSVSATRSGTPSSSATVTATPSASATETGTSSSSQTATPSSSETSSQTGTASSSASSSAAATSSPTAAATGTGTPASTGSGTAAATQSATKTRVALPSATATRTRTRTATASRTKVRGRRCCCAPRLAGGARTVVACSTFALNSPRTCSPPPPAPAK